MTSFTPKKYQQSALDALTDYFRQCGAGLSAGLAFAKITESLYEKPLSYTPLKGFNKAMPYFCLRVPTGGGKTWMAAKSIKLINQQLLRTENSVILWLTPSNAICSQTLVGLKNREHPLYNALSDAGAVTVLNLDEAKSVTRSTLDTSTVVIVATRQAFQVEKESLRKVYENNGELQHHFDNLSPDARQMLLHDIDEAGNDTIPYSLVNVLRMRRPFIIVDEAHNNRTELAFDTLAKFLPSGIMELTATPDTRKTPSNVLHSVSAVELKNEEMIKLPIILHTITDWRQCLSDAIDCRNKLQACVDESWKPGLRREKPLVLIQAEARNSEKDTLHSEAVKEELINNHAIPENEICIATGDEKGLESLDKQYAEGINDPKCPVRYVITQKALAEGWDCPWAYVLVSLANTSSSTAVEQLLGRVLRQPNAKKHRHEALNRSYAYVVSNNFTATANALRDQLVSIAGFERKVASQFVVPAKPDSQYSLFKKTVEIVVPDHVEIKSVPPALNRKVQWNELTRTLIIKNNLEAKEIKAVQNIVSDENIKQKIADASSEITLEHEADKTPSEKGEKVVIPQLSLVVRIGGQEERVPFIDVAGQLRPVVKIQPEDVIPSPSDLSALSVDKSESGQIDVDQNGKIISEFMKEVQFSLNLVYPPENWDIITLAAWICDQIDTLWLDHGLKIAFVQEWLDNLIRQSGFSLSQAVRKKAIIRNLIELRLEKLRKEAVNEVGQATLFTEEGQKRLRVDEIYSFEFSTEDYYPSRIYDKDKSEWGSHIFQKHYYPLIGDFDSKEEFECAVFLDNEAIKGNIKFWIRNLVKTPNSFSLTKIDGKYYPDFICILPDNTTLIVEYKGANMWDTEKVNSDRAIGELWAKLSNGKCKYIMVKDKNWNIISELI